MEEKTDEDIAREVQQGNVESFGILMSRYENKLSRYGRKFLTDSEDITDLVHEVFIKAYMNINSFDANRKFSSWIYRIAHNQFINSMKKKWRDVVFPLDFDLMFPHLVAEETADGESNATELKNMLNQCLDKLNPKYREPLILHYFEEMDYQNIADVLRIPASTVGVRLRRGRILLKKLVGNLDKSYE